MADNVAITAGTGTSIATDEITGTGEHVQLTKLAIATDGSRTLIPADGTDGLLVNLGSNNDVVESSGSAIKDAVQLIDDAVVFDDGAFTPGTTKVMMAGFEVDDTSTDLADEGDAVAARCTADRRQIVMLGEAGGNDVRGGGTKTDTSDQAVMAAGGAGVYNYLQWVTVYNASATNTSATIKDGSTVVAVLPLPAYGGAIFQPARPIRGTANTAWNVASGASVTTAHFYGGGFKALA